MRDKLANCNTLTESFTDSEDPQLLIPVIARAVFFIFILSEPILLKAACDKDVSEGRPTNKYNQYQSFAHNFKLHTRFQILQLTAKIFVTI